MLYALAKCCRMRLKAMFSEILLQYSTLLSFHRVLRKKDSIKGNKVVTSMSVPHYLLVFPV